MVRRSQDSARSRPDPSYAKCVPCPDDVLNDQSKVAPQLFYLTLNIQSGTTMDYSLDNSPSIEDTFSCVQRR